MPRKKGYKSQYPYVGTMGRIRGLAAYREQHIKEMGTPPVWIGTVTFFINSDDFCHIKSNDEDVVET